MRWAFAEKNIGDVHMKLALLGAGRAEYFWAIERFESAKPGLEAAGLSGATALMQQKIDLIRKLSDESRKPQNRTSGRSAFLSVRGSMAGRAPASKSRALPAAAAYRASSIVSSESTWPM